MSDQLATFLPENVTLASSMQSLTFGVMFHQNLENVTLPSSTQCLTFGALIHQNLENVRLPNDAQCLICSVMFTGFWGAWRSRAACGASPSAL